MDQRCAAAVVVHKASKADKRHRIESVKNADSLKLYLFTLFTFLYRTSI
jgi:hypothetical protein